MIIRLAGTLFELCFEMIRIAALDGLLNSC